MPVPGVADDDATVAAGRRRQLAPATTSPLIARVRGANAGAVAIDLPLLAASGPSRVLVETASAFAC